MLVPLNNGDDPAFFEDFTFYDTETDDKVSTPSALKRIEDSLTIESMKDPEMFETLFCGKRFQPDGPGVKQNPLLQNHETIDFKRRRDYTPLANNDGLRFLQAALSKLGFYDWLNLYYLKGRKRTHTFKNKRKKGRSENGSK